MSARSTLTTALSAFLVFCCVLPAQSLGSTKPTSSPRTPPGDLAVARPPSPPAIAPTEPRAAGEVRVFQDGHALLSGSPDFTRDVKVVCRVGDAQRLINYPAGYQITVPLEMEFDFRYSPYYVRVSSPSLDVKISREHSPYEDVEAYLRDYPNRFIAREDYQSYRKANAIDLIDDCWETMGERRVRIISFHRATRDKSPHAENDYLLAYMLTGQQEFYALFFRTSSLSQERGAIFNILESFMPIEPRGGARLSLDLHPVPGRWNAETRAFYDRLVRGREFLWGVFSPWAVSSPYYYRSIDSMEQRLGFRFPVLLHYAYLDHRFPTSGAERAYERGQVVELTLQVAIGGNENAQAKNPNFDLLDGLLDEQLREFARNARDFRHPFLFRLNNEMNTDWAQYSGVRTFLDVDIYIEVWRHVFRIFEEEGVDNAIWVFNPNNRTYPPMNWNDQVCYYPGNEYVHVIGLTGYNTGDYFATVTGERWLTFRQIYDPLVNEYRQVYSRFPWMITEFACSSVGGDKAQWIGKMFDTLPEYPEIKAAVWWSYTDFDYRPGKKGIPARRYWLDEKDEYLEAFREGLKKQGLIR